ncbi:substrate-binding domain-containing protein [Microbacterium sp. KR10-403]|uniref:sugar ABC transporter substrate-binding protein n=1 Tax=Microbacterium sp. KR10-403 TaxID=3158581 RepID=UPI0032E4EF0E
MTSSPRMRLMRAVTAGAAVATVALSLAACSSTSDDKAASSPAASAENTASSALAALQKPLDAYPVPTEPVTGATDLAGGTLYYIPITSQSPEFAVDQAGVKAAADALGMKVQVCDGKGTPTEVSSCIDNATNAKATGIILDAVPYDMAANSIAAAQKAGIPVVIGNQVADDRHPTTATFTYTAVSGSAQQQALARWIIADSDGKANVLINETTDGHSQIQYVEDALSVFKDECPGCTVATNEISSANFSQVPSSTSSALLKNSDTDYLMVEFSQFLQASQAGVQNAGASGRLTVVTGSATLNDIKSVAAGTIGAATAQASAFVGWMYVDATLRLIAGQEVPEYTIPIRLFTKDTMSDVQLTDAAQASGEWFGPADFTDQFKKLWGLA